MELSQKLKNARLSRKISQKTLADALGVSRATVSAWEGAKAVPPVRYLRRYQEIFDFEKGYFDKDTAPEKQESSLTFDISRLNKDGVNALVDFYNSLISRE